METEVPTRVRSDCELQMLGRGLVTHLLRSRGSVGLGQAEASNHLGIPGAGNLSPLRAMGWKG